MFCTDILNNIFYYLKNKDARSFLSINKESWSLRERVIFQDYTSPSTKKWGNYDSYNILLYESKNQFHKIQGREKNIRRLLMRMEKSLDLSTFENLTDLEIVTYGDDCKIIFPKNLKNLSFSGKISGDLPEKLESLYVGKILFPQNGKLPESLKSLWAWALKIDSFPKGLESLTIFHHCSIPPLPESLIRAKFHFAYKGNIPSSLRKLHVSGCMPPNFDFGKVENLCLEFNEVNPPKIPKTVKKLSILGRTNYSLSGLIPDSVTFLKITENSQSLKGCIPSSVKKVVLKPEFAEDLGEIIPESVTEAKIIALAGFQMKTPLSKITKLELIGMKNYDWDNALLAVPNIRNLSLGFFGEKDKFDLGKFFPSLETLTLGKDCRRFGGDITSFPPSLKKIFFINCSLVIKKPLFLPELKEMMYLERIIDPLYIPSSVKILHISQSVYQKQEIPKGVEKIILYNSSGEIVCNLVRKNDKFV